MRTPSLILTTAFLCALFSSCVPKKDPEDRTAVPPPSPGTKMPWNIIGPSGAGAQWGAMQQNKPRR